jgi:hypothetical protein
MAMVRITPPAAVPVNEPTDRLELWLNRHGCRTANVAWDGADLLIDTTGDPLAALASYVSEPTPLGKAHARLAAYVQIYRDGGTPTPAQVARAVKTLAALALNDLDDAD